MSFCFFTTFRIKKTHNGGKFGNYVTGVTAVSNIRSFISIAVLLKVIHFIRLYFFQSNDLISVSNSIMLEFIFYLLYHVFYFTPILHTRLDTVLPGKQQRHIMNLSFKSIKLSFLFSNKPSFSPQATLDFFNFFYFYWITAICSFRTHLTLVLYVLLLAVAITPLYCVVLLLSGHRCVSAEFCIDWLLY